MRMENRGTITSLEQLVPLFLTQPWMQLALWTVLIRYWLMSSFSATSCPKRFLVGLLFISSTSSLEWYQAASFQLQELALQLVEAHEVHLDLCGRFLKGLTALFLSCVPEAVSWVSPTDQCLKRLKVFFPEIWGREIAVCVAPMLKDCEFCWYFMTSAQAVSNYTSLPS